MEQEEIITYWFDEEYLNQSVSKNFEMMKWHIYSLDELILHRIFCFSETSLSLTSLFLGISLLQYDILNDRVWGDSYEGRCSWTNLQPLPKYFLQDHDLSLSVTRQFFSVPSELTVSSIRSYS